MELDRLARARHRVVTAADLAGVGIDHNDIVRLRRDGRLIRLYHRTYAVPPVTEPPFRLACRGAVVFAGTGAVLLGEAALAFGGAYPAPAVPDVGVPRDRAVRGTPGLRVARCSPATLAHRTEAGVPVQLPARAVAWAWSRLPSEPDRAAVLCAAVTCGLTSPAEVHAAVAAQPGLRGRAALLAACDHVAAGCASPAEIDYLVRVERAFGLPPGERQAVVDVPGGRTRRVDVRYDRVVVEIDGAHHVRDPAQRADDAVRDVVLTALGFTVVRVPAADVRHSPGLVAATVRATLLASAAA